MSKRAREVIFERGFLWSRNAERAVEMAKAAMAPESPDDAVSAKA